MNIPAVEPVSPPHTESAAPAPPAQGRRRRVARSLLAGTAIVLNLTGIVLNTRTGLHTLALSAHIVAYTLMITDIALGHLAPPGPDAPRRRPWPSAPAAR